jgi:CxxC motif-containing protein
MCKLNNENSNKDIFTSIVRVKGSDKYKMAPVKSSQEVDRSLWIELSKVIGRIYVSLPIKVGSVICKNILNTGIDIICTRDLFDE